MKKAFLFLLGLIAFIGVQAQTSPYTGSEAAAGNFYIYNVETGYWLQNNNRVGDWNSQVQVDTEGFDWELIAQDGGTWQLNPKFGNNHSLNSADANGYMDTGQPVSAWTLTPANDGNNGYMISSNGTTLGVNLKTKELTKDGSGGTTWQLVTFAERWRVTEQKFSEVTGDNPMDLTWLIPGANMNIADEHFNDLIKVAPNSPGNFTTGQTNVAPGNGVREVWSNTNGGYDFGYKVTNLPAGVYRFTVKGYYSDGPRRDVGAKYKEGTEVIRPQVYANEKSQPILSICAPEKSSAVNGCNTNSSGIFVPNNTGEASQATAAGLYDNPAIKIVLADGADEIDLGVKCEEAGIGDDWVILDKFQLVYYGPDNIESSLALLNAAIEEAENWDQSSTSTAMANMLNEAIDEARGKLTSTDSDEVEAAADALKAALKAAQAVDVSVLKAVVELAKAEGIETTEAEQVIENATDGGAIGSVLNDLRVARKVAHLETDEATYEGNEPAEGDFYLYNVGRKAYLSSGSDWGTHAILGYPGLQATLATRGEGFTFQFNELIQGDARDKFMNASPYLDGEAGWATTYIFEPVEGKPGVYYIKGDGRGYLAFDPNGEVDGGGIKHFNTVTSLWATPEGEDAEWMLITKEQRLAQLENASKENPVDATLLIRDASFNKFAALDNPWTDINQSWGWGDRNFGDKNTESWNSQSYNLSQEVTFPKAGKYILSVQAYYRDGNRDTHANKVKNGETLHDAPVLYAGDVETPIVYIDSEVGKAPGEGEITVIGEYPNYMNQAAAFFQNGLYWNSIEVEIPEDNTTLTIGIKKTGSEYTAEDWTLADNFRLTYLGEVTDYDRALASIEDGKNYSVFTEVDGQKYYVTADGKLTNDESARGAFGFQKVNGAQYAEGFLLNSQNNTRFSNPYTTTEAALTNGSLNISTNNRADWEAQVFFQNTDGKYAVRATNAKYNGETSGWAWIGNTYWTANAGEEGPLAEYQWEPNYIWQLEENQTVDVALNLVLEEKVIATEKATLAVGLPAPALPAAFKSNADVVAAYNGLVYFEKDVDTIEEGTTEVNFVAESAISESFERAKWFNMNIRGSYWVTMDETEPYYPTVDKDLESEASLWAFGAVEGEPNQIVIWNRAAGPDMSLLNTGESDANGKPLVAMREGQTAWDFAPNSDGFVIHQVGTGENEWVNQNGGASGPFSIWNSANAKGDGGSVLRIFFVEETEPIDPYDAALAEIKDGHHYRVFTEVDGEKYYVNGDGTLTTDVEEAPSYLFQKTLAASGSYEYGFKLNNNGNYFSNPPSPSEASLNSGHINTNGSGRDTWEAQVFFLNADGLYAVRSTNAPDGGEGSWEWIGSAYWTVNEGPVAEYQWEPNYVWQLEEDMSYIELALNLVYNGEVVETQPATYQVGDTPAIPTAFYTKMADELFGLVTFSSDVDEVTEETTEVNFTAKSILSESFEGAKWFNMHIRGLDANAPYWVNKDETEPYYPRGDKDLTAPESQWAFTSADGEPNHIIIWNRADDSAMTLTDADGNVVMREGDFVWEIFPNNTGFVMRPLGGDENHWVNQNGGNSGPLQFWNSVNGKGDDGSTFRVVPVETDNLELAIDVERYVGQGYTPTIAEVDFTEALEYLGVEAVTEDMLYFVNPDGTEMDYATYKVSPTPDFTYDGWCDAEGAAAQWGSTTMINVKFFEAIPDGQFSICDMNGADEVGKTYTVKWALKANDKAVVYAVNVTFVDAPVVDLTFDDLNQVSTAEITVQSELGAYWEGLQASVDIDAILAALGVESLDDVTITAVQSDGYLEVQYQRGANGEDGWRDENGDFMNYPGKFYVKADFTRAENQLYEIGTDQPGLTEPAQFTATYAFIKTGTEDAVVLKVNLVYGESGAVAYDGTVDVTAKIQGQVVAEAPTADETITITPNEDGTVNINFASLTLAAPGLLVNDFIVENVVVTENEDGSVSYSLEGATVTLTAASGMTITYNATLTGTQAEGEGPELTLILAQPSGLQNEIVFHPNALVPEAEEFDGMIKQILSHPQTGVQGQATGEQKVTIAATGDGKADITYSGFTMPVTGAEIPEFTVEGVIVTENEDGTISYALPEDAEAEVIIDRGTFVVKYAVTLEGTQESADATPVLKLTLENSVVDTVWFGADEKTIDKAIATSIRGINALGTEGNIYDLSGRKVEKIQRGGIYIVNGKKVSVK